MVYYYCEFCNKNINVRAATIPICKNCGHLLISSSITTQERLRRERAQTTYCEYCDLMVYGVPVDTAINIHSQETQLRANQVKNPPSPELIRQDRRYKKGFRLTSEGETYCCKIIIVIILIIILIVFAVSTYGLALLVLIPIYLYFRKKKKEKNFLIQNIYNTGQNLISILYEIKNQFQFVCHRCLNGVIIGTKPYSKETKDRTESISITIPVLRYCELCGAENKSDTLFCVECGSKLRSVNSG